MKYYVIFNWLLLGSAFMGGCTPAPVYVLERVEGGDWIRSLSADVARDSLIWRVEHTLDARYREAVNGLREEAIGELRLEVPELFTNFHESIDLRTPLVKSENLQGLIQLWSSLERFAFPVDEWVTTYLKERGARVAEGPVAGLRDIDRKRIRGLVLEHPEGPIHSLNDIFESEVSLEGDLWKVRYQESLSRAKEALKKDLEAELRAVVATHAALAQLSRKPAENVYVNSKYVPPIEAGTQTLTLGAYVEQLRGLSGISPEEHFRAFLPVHEQFWRLSDAFLAYGAMVRRGGWDKLDFRTTLKKGSRGKKVRELRERLRREGFAVDVPEEQTEIFGAPLQRALRDYQRLHFLATHGKLDEKTRRVLNRTAEERWTEIGLTLWKWATSRMVNPDEDHIFINVPTFQGSLWRGGESVHQFKVAVGKSRRRKTQKRGWHYPNATPELMSVIRHVVMEPRWEYSLSNF